MEEVLRLTQSMELVGAATSEAAIAEVERMLGMKLPQDYAEFVLLRNGAAGPVGQGGWARFIAVEDLVEENKQCSELDHLAGWLLFGSDGGGEAFLFDEAGQVLVAPWIGGREDAFTRGRFPEFVRHLAGGALFP